MVRPGKVMTSAIVMSCMMMNGITPLYMCMSVISGGEIALK